MSIRIPWDKDSFLEYISKPINRNYFDSLIKEDDYAWEFPEMSVDDQSVACGVLHGQYADC